MHFGMNKAEIKYICSIMKYLLSTITLLATFSAVYAQNELQSSIVKIDGVSVADKVVGYIADDNEIYKMSHVTLDFEDYPSTSVDGTFTLNPVSTYQKIDGFGFSITGSASYNLLKMDSDQRTKLLTQIFSTSEGYGCSYVRVPIGCSDFSLSDYTCCDTFGIENFALTEEETEYIIPVMKEILAINPNVKVISAPWTAPRWMKTNGNWTDGNLKRECYQDYATYFVKWIQAFKNNGIEIYGVTPQNEPLNRGNSASMYMSWEEARDFIKTALGPKFKEHNVSTKIYVFDHNYNYDNIDDQRGYPTKIYSDADAVQYIAGAAYHNYGGNATEMSRVHNEAPSKELIFTEWTAGTWSWPGVGMESITSDSQALIYDVLNNWGQGAIVWNLMLDSDRGPYRPGGCSTGNGAIDINNDGYNQLTYNSFYYVICIAASAVSQDAIRIGTTGSANDVQIVAFKNTDGYGAILMNRSDSERKVRISAEGCSFVATLAAKSISSYRWF